MKRNRIGLIKLAAVGLALYTALMDGQTNPPKSLHILDESIDRLRLQEADLERAAGPLDEARKRAQESLERIERSWLKRHPP